ncbi:unnamed protein product [Prunus armeniaca]
MAFRCLGTIGAYEWVVMPYGLKNIDATYQRAMNLIFHNLIGRTIELYIDDVVCYQGRTCGTCSASISANVNSRPENEP